MNRENRYHGAYVRLGAVWLACVCSPAFSQVGEHKVVAAPGVLDEHIAGIRLIQSYDSYALYRVSDSALNDLPRAVRDNVRVVDEMDLIQLDAGPLNTRQPVPSLPSHLSAPIYRESALQLVQFVGPIREEWLERLRALGVRPVHYVESNAYIVWTHPAAREALDRLVVQDGFLQYSGPYHPFYKLGPTLREPLSGSADVEGLVPVTIQILDHEGNQGTRARIEAASISVDAPWYPILAYENVDATVPLSRIAALAALPDVVWIEERLPLELHDEVQGQILASHFDAGRTGPSGPGYKAFVDGKGFSTDPNAYPIVVITDGGVGNGTVTAGAGDPTLTRFADGTTTRLTSVVNCTTDADGSDTYGHGHLATSIVGGYDLRSDSPYQDENGFQRGLGMNPYGRMAHTKVFTHDGRFSVGNCGGSYDGVIAANYSTGARISSNSWGGSLGYGVASQAYDAGTRDALPGTAGNQELLFVFSAGNDGPNSQTVKAPGNGKNVIAVGASENDRPNLEGGCFRSGDADHAMDVAGFSSRGPSPGGRAKPEVIAPGTRIQGTASPAPGYTGICGPYLPSGQAVFTAANGTSFSAPAVAGVVSLYFRWLQDYYLSAAPSPALAKAYTIAHTTYLTGEGANDTLPSNSQGYGMPDLEMAFDGSAVRYFLDQSVVFDNSGETWTFNGSILNPERPVRIVLVYTDAPGAAGTSPQVNNLNLTATVDGTTYLGNVFSGRYSVPGGAADSANNYEAIFLPANLNASGELSITVTGFNIAGDGVPNAGDATDQDFALVCYNCSQDPTFTLGATPIALAVCSPNDAVYDITVGSVGGFNELATLATSGLPAGATSSFTVNPVTPPGTSQLIVGNTGAVTPGAYSFDLVASNTLGEERRRDLALTVSDAAPLPPTPLTPINGAPTEPLRPMFTWSAVPQAATYAIEIATDSGFGTIVHSASGLTTTAYVPASGLASNTIHYWRVRAQNPCGSSASSPSVAFNTVALPGECPIGTSAEQLYFTNFEAGTAGFSSGGSGNTWALSTSRSYSATTSYKAVDSESISDQQLVSPLVALPTGQNPVSLGFYNYQAIEQASLWGCFDGGILEISTSGPGGPWTQLDVQLLTDPYDAKVQGSSNPLYGLNAWCGDPQDWTRSLVDLTPYAGLSVHLRWRLGSDGGGGREGWYVDDVLFQACPPSPPPPPVPDGGWQVLGVPMRASAVSGGSTVHVTWDTTTCQAANYNLYYGMGAQLPAALGGSYGLSGAILGIGTSGSYDWTGAPDPGDDSKRLLWWVVVGTNGVSIEGSWGSDTSGQERMGLGVGGASGQGPFQTKDTSHQTCP